MHSTAAALDRHRSIALNLTLAQQSWLRTQQACERCGSARNMFSEFPKCFPQNVQFRHTWRPYQARVLAELDTHLDDNHFHLIAAPGSGKTVVGLEALRRVNKPALVFVPTVAIRDQWLRRFLDCFWNEAAARLAVHRSFSAAPADTIDLPVAHVLREERRDCDAREGARGCRCTHAGV